MDRAAGMERNCWATSYRPYVVRIPFRILFIFTQKIGECLLLLWGPSHLVKRDQFKLTVRPQQGSYFRTAPPALPPPPPHSPRCSSAGCLRHFGSLRARHSPLARGNGARRRLPLLRRSAPLRRSPGRGRSHRRRRRSPCRSRYVAASFQHSNAWRSF
jgi:hypothetical protein